MKRIIQFGVIASLALAPAAVLADSPDYTYFEAAFVVADIDGIDDGDGFGLAGSAQIGENVFIFVDYSTVGFSGGVDFNVVNAGIGYRSSISDTSDVNVSISYVSSEVDTIFGGFDEDGYAVDASLRSMLSNEFELNGGITYVNLGGNFDDETSFHAGGVYSFNETFAVTGDIAAGDNVTTYLVGVRFYSR